MVNPEEVDDPETLLTEVDLDHLSPEAKVNVVRSALLRFIKDNAEGVSANQIAEATGLSHSVVKKHLEFLTATRQVYKKVYSPRNIIYFPNGRLSHPYARDEVSVGAQTFRFNLLENQAGEYLYIQEMDRTPNSGEHVAGGIIIRQDHIDKFLQALYQFMEDKEDHDDP